MLFMPHSPNLRFVFPQIVQVICSRNNQHGGCCFLNLQICWPTALAVITNKSFSEDTLNVAIFVALNITDVSKQV